jgi:hypothetical protein
MGSWLSWLIRERLLDVALALALGTAGAAFAEALVGVPISALVQNIGRYPGEDGDIIGLLDLFSAPYYLNFSIGGTVIAYGHVLATSLTLGVLVLASVVIVRRSRRVLGTCPFCASVIPLESTHCAFCGSGVSPVEH